MAKQRGRVVHFEEGPQSGCPKAVALAVLRNQGVTIAEHPDGMVHLAKGDADLCLDLPNTLQRRMLHTLQRVFGVPIVYFYNPEMILPPRSGDTN